MDENFLQNLKLNITFYNVKYLIENKKSDLGKNSKVYIEWAREYFQNATRSIDSMLDFESSGSYHITPHLLEIIKYFKENENPNSVQRAKNIRTKFNYIIKSLGNLKESPKEFYKGEDAPIMLDYFNNFVDVTINQ